jgi:putative ABC transport system permease protein
MMREPLLLAGANLRGRRRFGVLATALVLLLASVGMSAGLTVVGQGAPLLDAAADDADVAHLVLYGDADALMTAAAEPDVVASSGPFAAIDTVELLVGEEPIPIQMTALDDPDVAVNHPPITSGRWAQAPDEVVFDRSLAVDAGLEPGDTARFGVGDRTLEFVLAGTAVDFTDCFYPLCDPGRVWVTADGLDRMDAADDEFSQMWLRFDDPGAADPFVERLAASGAAGIGGSNSWLDTRGDFLTLDQIFGSFLAAFGVFVLVCSAVVVAGATAMRIVARRREIGLLGAIGCRPREIATSLVLENVAVGAVAATIGWALAGFAVPSLQVGIGATLGPQDAAWSVGALLVTLTVITSVLVVATLVPAVRAARRPVTDVLRDVPPEWHQPAQSAHRRRSRTGCRGSACRRPPASRRGDRARRAGDRRRGDRHDRLDRLRRRDRRGGRRARPAG